MNELIKTIFTGFTVDGVEIPVKFLRYDGSADTYIVYTQVDINTTFSGDDTLIGYVVYYDFDVYSKGDYTAVIESMRAILEDNNFRWQASQSSSDMYEVDTGYYHKTMNFAIQKEEN